MTLTCTGGGGKDGGVPEPGALGCGTLGVPGASGVAPDGLVAGLGEPRGWLIRCPLLKKTQIMSIIC